MPRHRYPKVAYTLAAEDFCAGWGAGDRSTVRPTCLLGHLWRQFYEVRLDAVRTLRDVVLEEAGESGTIANWNDCIARDNEHRAQVWNKFIARLGYTEDA